MLQKDAAISNRSFRLDQALGRNVQFFARYSSVPSSSTTLELGTANARFSWLTATAGFNIATANTNARGPIQFFAGSSGVHALGGVWARTCPALTSSASLADSARAIYFRFGKLRNCRLPVWAKPSPAKAGKALNINGKATTISQGMPEHHDLRFGADYVRLASDDGVFNGTLAVVSPSIDALLAGVPLDITVSSSPLSGAAIQKLSFFGQDTSESANASICSTDCVGR